MSKLPLYKQLLSYIYPVHVRTAKGSINPVLELYRYQGQWQLATLDAMYSDGDRYRPLTAAFKAVATQLPQVKDVLVLGTGLGSAVQILRKNGYNPHFTLVDIDEIVLQWALEHMEDAGSNIEPICTDARDFIDTTTSCYDLIVVDIFQSRVVPDFVTTIDFIEKCRGHLHTGGIWVFNYIVTDEAKWAMIVECISTVFPQNKIINLGPNRVVVATV